MRRQWRLGVILFFVTLLTGFFAGASKPETATAANPSTMSFQGKVVNSDGTNVANGSYSFVFKLYNVSSSGSAIWTETQSSVTVNAGVFHVDLGSVCPFLTSNDCNNNTPIDFNSNSSLYLGITFNGDPAGEMSPRVQLQSVPFAFNADRVGGLTVNELVQLSPSVTQAGYIDVGGDIYSGGEVQGVTLTAVGALQGNTLSINSGNFEVTSAGAVTGGTYNGATLSGTELTGSGALSITSGGSNQSLSVNASGSGQVLIGGTSTGNILFGGGSGSTGCTLTNSTGDFSCSGIISGSNLQVTQVNGTTGIYTGALGGTQRIDGSGNLVNIAQATVSGQAVFNDKVGIGNNAPEYLLHVGDDNTEVGAVAHFQNSAGTCTITPDIAGGVTCTSDERFKKDIEGYSSQTALDKILGVNVVDYRMSGKDSSTQKQTGVIAQQLIELFPDLVSVDAEGNYSVSYSGLTPYLVGAIQAQQAQLEDIRAALSAGQDVAPLFELGEGVGVQALEEDDDGFGVVGESLFGDALSIDSKGSEYINVVSDLSHDVEGISFVAVPANTDHDTTGLFVKQAAGDGAHGLDAGIRIDNENMDTQIGAALQFDNTGGGGYQTLIGSTNFTVSGSGDITTNGSITAHNSLRLLSPSGQIFTIDSEGNANLNGALDATAANLSGALNVGGDANFAGLTTFQKLATFIGKTIFRQDVEFEGAITVAKDTAGYAKIRPGENSVHVTFTKPYASAPIVSANIVNGQFAKTSINNVTVNGFDISLSEPVNVGITLSWTALMVRDPQTAINPPSP